ncbi:MAG TPA: hypothetical protein VJB36_00125, partial [Methylomirabilota bacterium]|nr:hypothetical protein [Methylomirabilota bacterium]
LPRDRGRRGRGTARGAGGVLREAAGDGDEPGRPRGAAGAASATTSVTGKAGTIATGGCQRPASSE